MKSLLVIAITAITTACTAPASNVRVQHAGDTTVSTAAPAPACREIPVGDKPARCEAVRPDFLR